MKLMFKHLVKIQVEKPADHRPSGMEHIYRKQQIQSFNFQSNIICSTSRFLVCCCGWDVYRRQEREKEEKTTDEWRRNRLFFTLGSSPSRWSCVWLTLPRWMLRTASAKRREKASTCLVDAGSEEMSERTRADVNLTSSSQQHFFLLSAHRRFILTFLGQTAVKNCWKFFTIWANGKCREYSLDCLRLTRSTRQKCWLGWRRVSSSIYYFSDCDHIGRQRSEISDLSGLH